MTDATQEPGLDAAGLEAATAQARIGFGHVGRRENFKDYAARIVRAYEAHRSGAGEAPTSEEMRVALADLQQGDRVLAAAGEKLISTPFSGVRTAIRDAVSTFSRAAPASMNGTQGEAE